MTDFHKTAISLAGQWISASDVIRSHDGPHPGLEQQGWCCAASTADISCAQRVSRSEGQLPFQNLTSSAQTGVLHTAVSPPWDAAGSDGCHSKH